MEAGEFALHKKQHARKELETEQQATCWEISESLEMKRAIRGDQMLALVQTQSAALKSQ